MTIDFLTCDKCAKYLKDLLDVDWITNYELTEKEEIDKYINNCISVRKIEKCEICGKNQITTELSFFEDKQLKMREIILKILQEGVKQ